MARIGRFISDDARVAHEEAYARAMELWPPHESLVVPTAFGPTGAHVVRSTSAAAGGRPPIVLLHSFSSTSAQWWCNVPDWAADRDVYSIDAICEAGASRQTAPVRGGGNMADWLDEVLEGLGLTSVHLAGLSYGGWVTVNQGVRSPGKLRTIIAMDPAASFTHVPMSCYVTLLRATLATTPQGRWGWVLDDTSPQEHWELLNAARGYKWAGLPTPWRMRSHELAGIPVPVLVILGSHSVVTSHGAVRRRLARVLPQAQIEVVHARHNVPTDNPEDTARLTRAFMAANDQ